MDQQAAPDTAAAPPKPDTFMLLDGTELLAPPNVLLQVTPAGYQLLRNFLGTQPLDMIGGMVRELESQVTHQVIGFNEHLKQEAAAQAAAQAAAAKPSNRAQRRAAPRKRRA
jgi:hypothetical protein